MKKFLLLFLFPIFSFQFLLAQDLVVMPDSQYIFSGKHELSVNVTQFLKNIVVFNTVEINDDNALLVSYKYLINQNQALRFGLDMLFSKEQNPRETNIGVVQEINRNWSVEILGGYMLTRTVSKRWWGYVSFDTFFQRFNGRRKFVENDVTVQSTRSNQFGIGPAIGMQFFITPRISIGTESALYYKFTKLQIDRDLNQNGVFDDIQNTKTNLMRINLPASLYFNARF